MIKNLLTFKNLDSIYSVRTDFKMWNIYFFSDANDIKINKQVGHMLRTKLSHVNEGGVAAGLGALDSVYLVDNESCCKGSCVDCNSCC